jgi:hypothetical protein
MIGYDPLLAHINSGPASDTDFFDVLSENVGCTYVDYLEFWIERNTNIFVAILLFHFPLFHSILFSFGYYYNTISHFFSISHLPNRAYE